MATCGRCGATLVPLWRYDDLFCPNDCELQPERQRWWIGQVNAYEINRDLWFVHKARQPRHDYGTWVYVKEGPEPKWYEAERRYRTQAGTIYEVCLDQSP